MFQDRDPIAEGHKQHREKEKAETYKARVIGKRVTVTSDLDFGKSGVVVDVVESMLQVALDDYPNAPYLFARNELEAAR